MKLITKNIAKTVAAAGLCIVMVFGTAGCTDFLNLPARNEQTIETLEDVRALLGSYLAGVRAYPVQAGLTQIGMKGVPMVTQAMIDMFECYSDNLDFDKALSLYITPRSGWNQNTQFTWEEYRRWLLWDDYTTPKQIWDKYYDLIGYLNTLIREVDMVETGGLDESERARMKGEMLVHRAFYFFKLLQYFAPYTDNALGIPVYLNTGENVLDIDMSRRSHSEVYAVILNDLNEAERLLETTAPRETFNIFFRGERLFHLMAQVYWFKGDSPAAGEDDWENAAKYARKVIDMVPESAIPQTGLAFVSTQGNIAAAATPGYPGFYVATSNSTTYFGRIYGVSYYYLNIQLGDMRYGPYDIPVSEELYGMFEPGDLRSGELIATHTSYGDMWSGYFQQDKETPTLSRIWTSPNPAEANPTTRIIGQNRGKVMMFKPEDMYLILAEALYHTGGDAAGTLNKFKSLRKAGSTALTGEALYREILNERRKESFVDYDKRWLDLKKYAEYTNTTVVRNLAFDSAAVPVPATYDGNTDAAWRAEPNSYKYALPIPMDSEIQNNRNLTQNPGWTQPQF